MPRFNMPFLHSCIRVWLFYNPNSLIICPDDKSLLECEWSEKWVSQARRFYAVTFTKNKGTVHDVSILYQIILMKRHKNFYSLLMKCYTLEISHAIYVINDPLFSLTTLSCYRKTKSFNTKLTFLLLKS